MRRLRRVAVSAVAAGRLAAEMAMILVVGTVAALVVAWSEEEDEG